ncbi:MAG: serine/threonine protein phosphatase [Rhodospirillaceae bacterium]|nr:serine/threonine protein phosphatase [Rhodospirillaceae bacterium]
MAAGKPSIPQGMILYAIGDIHGRADLLAALLRSIASDMVRIGLPDRRLVFLGDYVDRWPLVPQVLDILLDHLPPGTTATFLRGNHEQMMLDFLDDAEAAHVWVGNGGDTTLEGYGVRWFNDRRTVREDLMRQMPARHRQFLTDTTLNLTVGDYFFVHAGVRPGVSLDAQAPQDMMWIRNRFLDSKADFGKVVVHGHTITDAPEIRANRIGIDTGAVMTGRLTSLVLHGAERRFLST